MVRWQPKPLPVLAWWKLLFIGSALMWLLFGYMVYKTVNALPQDTVVSYYEI